MKRIASQVYAALAYLHGIGVIHRDIKPQNIMIDRRGERAVLCDFGLGRMCGVPLGGGFSGTCCTMWYRPPELLLGARAYGVEIDMWAAALVVHEMSTGAVFVAGNNGLDQLFGIFRRLGTPDESVWPGVTSLPHYIDSFPVWNAVPLESVYSDADLVDFMRRSLVYVPAARLSAKRALEHSFLK